MILCIIFKEKISCIIAIFKVDLKTHTYNYKLSLDKKCYILFFLISSVIKKGDRCENVMKRNLWTWSRIKCTFHLLFLKWEWTLISEIKEKDIVKRQTKKSAKREKVKCHREYMHIC